jgi:L-rhamnose isomerase/sugar isomerase
MADGTNYPGQDSIRGRKQRLENALGEFHGHLADDQLFLVEYKPFEPAFYHTDIADWGMSYIYAKKMGPQAKVLVDTGHHYQAQNIEQIVAWLLDDEMLGGFHFNDRRYADDDLTLGSIDPYQIFRIFSEIHGYAASQGGKYPAIEYMVDQSHNLKPKMEAMIETVTAAQELYVKAALVDHEQLQKEQEAGSIIDAERLLKKAFGTDVSGAIAEWRKGRGLAPDPLMAFRESGYLEKISTDRKARRKELGITGGGYA